MAHRNKKRRALTKRASKQDLPHKVCPVCQRPFSWRKKWRDCWEEVRYCSRRCRGERHLARERTTS